MPMMMAIIDFSYIYFFSRSQIIRHVCDTLLYVMSDQNAREKKMRCEPKKYHIRINMFEFI